MKLAPLVYAYNQPQTVTSTHDVHLTVGVPVLVQDREVTRVRWLVLLASLAAGWLRWEPPPRRTRLAAPRWICVFHLV